MEGKYILSHIRAELEIAKKKKRDAVSISALEDKMMRLEDDIVQSTDAIKRQHEHSIEAFKATSAREIAQSQIDASFELARFNSMILTGQSAFKAAMLMNGGAAIAMLTFITHMYDKIANPKALYLPMVGFCTGVFFSMLSLGLTYLAQLALTRDSKENIKVNKKEDSLNKTYFAWFVVAGAYTCFFFSFLGILNDFISNDAPFFK